MIKILICAEIVYFTTALIHKIAGHFAVVIPFTGLEFDVAVKAILHSSWHMVTLTLFFLSCFFLRLGIQPEKQQTKEISRILGMPDIGFRNNFHSLKFCLFNISLPIAFIAHNWSINSLWR